MEEKDQRKNWSAFAAKEKGIHSFCVLRLKEARRPLSVVDVEDVVTIDGNVRRFTNRKEMARKVQAKIKAARINGKVVVEKDGKVTGETVRVDSSMGSSNQEDNNISRAKGKERPTA